MSVAVHLMEMLTVLSITSLTLTMDLDFLTAISLQLWQLHLLGILLVKLVLPKS